METSVDDDDVVGSRRTASNMAAVSALPRICDRKSDRMGCAPGQRNVNLIKMRLYSREKKSYNHQQNYLNDQTSVLNV